MSRDVAQQLSVFLTCGEVLGSSPSFQVGREGRKEGEKPTQRCVRLDGHCTCFPEAEKALGPDLEVSLSTAQLLGDESSRL